MKRALLTETAQSFLLMGLMAFLVGGYLCLGLLAARVLG